MSHWKRQAIGDLPLYQATTMSWLPGIVQGFTTRAGGVSKAPYDTLNLGVHVGDDRDDVQRNRERLWTDLGFVGSQVAMAEQVHGGVVAAVTAGTETPVAGVDALITNTPDVLLMMLYADCVPVYIVDPVSKCIGLVHSGWRGAAENVVGQTIAAMKSEYKAAASSCLVAVGPCVAAENYEVHADVADRFRNFPGGREAGSAVAVLPKNEFNGTYYLNLRQLVFSQILAAGVRAEYIAVADLDTFRNRREFFSYRRDGKTGRMAAFLALRSR